MSLTKAQEGVISALKSGSTVWVDGYKEPKAWVDNQGDGMKQKGLQYKTVKILIDSGYLALTYGDYPSWMSRYTLTKKGQLYSQN